MDMSSYVHPYMEIYYSHIQCDIIGSRMLGPLAMNIYSIVFYHIILHYNLEI